jgi:anaerobic selenocysteine-containing dehydrogenase
MARHLVDKGLVDQDFVNNYSHGYRNLSLSAQQRYRRVGIGNLGWRRM